MLLAIRERVMGIVGWFILGILFIAFAFFGLNSYLDSDVASYVASVNGVEINARQEDRAYRNLISRMENLMGSSFDPDMIDEAQLRKNALRQIINEELLFQEALDGDFAASDQQLAAQISAISAFKKDGKFSKQRYERALSNSGMTSSQFEGQLKREIMSDHLRSGIINTAAPTHEALASAYRLQGEQRRFSYLILPVSKFNKQVKVTDADIDQFYDEHGSEYMTPERVKIQYLELQAASLEPGTEPDEAALRALYDEESGRFTTEEERHARHILVMFTGTDEESIRQAASRAEEIVKRLDAGEAFDVLAKEVSEDPGSASSGGDLGFFGRGIMAAEFEDAVFDMQAGERSQPVRSSYGLHIIELLDIKPETVQPFEEVRASLAEQLLSDERSDLFYDQSEVLANLSFEYPDTLQEAANGLGLEIQESDWISAGGGPAIGENPAVIEAAFSDDVLLGGNNSKVVEMGEDHMLVLRVSAHQKSAQKPLEEVNDLIRQDLLDEQVRALAKAKGEELLASLQAGVALEEIAKQQVLETGRTDLLGRQAATPQRSLVQKAFSLATPKDGETVSGGFVMNDGNYAIVLLEETSEGRLESLNESSRVQSSQELGKLQGAADMAAVMAALNEQATVLIPKDKDQ
jgi:peptidyl-prolyl cis-trans isomerase D